MKHTTSRRITRVAALAAIGLLTATASASAADAPKPGAKLTRAQAAKLSADPHVTKVKRAPKRVASAAQASGCTFTNSTDVQIVDLQTVESTINVTGCAGNASATSTAEVHIVHTYGGDLVVSLIAPDGSSYILSNRSGGSADNLDQIYTVNLGSEVANGTWRLRVQDAAASDTGFINTWTLNLGSPVSTCVATNPTDLRTVDLTTVESPLTIAGCSGNASATSTVEVHIVHTYRGDLVVSLVAPDGSVYILSNRLGGSADNIDQTYTVNLSSEARNGTWRLRVQDAAAADSGYLNSWTLSL